MLTGVHAECSCITHIGTIFGAKSGRVNRRFAIGGDNYGSLQNEEAMLAVPLLHCLAKIGIAEGPIFKVRNAHHHAG